MKKKRWFFLILLVALTAAVPAVQPEKMKKSLSFAGQMEKLLFEANRLDRPGIAVTVVKDEEVIFQNAYGLACMEHHIHNTNKTLFDVTALAEPFTGMAIAMLEAQGKLSPDDDIRKHIPELQDFGETVTLRHLLYHTSGIWDWSEALIAAGWEKQDLITFDHILRMVKRQEKLQFKPGSKYSFSKTNYNLLAETVKRVTGQSFRDWTWENIFRPLGMLKTLVRDRHGEPIENQAYGYTYHRLRGYQKGSDNLIAVGSNCLFSSIEDMSKWLLKLETGDIAGSTVIKKIFNNGFLDNGEKIDYAFGWNIDTYKGLKCFSASGQWEGFSSVLYYFPQQKFGVVVLSNWISGWINPSNLAKGIVNIYLKPYLKDTKTPSPDSTSKAKEIKPDTDRYARYVGEYRWYPGYVVSILQEKEKLMLQIPGGKYPLLPQSEAEFILTVADYRLTFQKNKEGNVHQVVIQQGDEDGVIAPKIKLVKPTPGELHEFTGNYYCRELDARYSFIIRDKKLVITHIWQNDINLTPESRNHFTTNSGNYPMIVFSRDKQQNVSGFKWWGFPMMFKKK